MNPTTTENAGVLPEEALRAFAAAAASVGGVSVAFEAPRRPEFGDFATNVAFSLAKTARRAPQEVAASLIADVTGKTPELARLFSAVEPVAGFINLRLAPQIWQNAVARILRDPAHFGEAPPNGLRISLEFGSANPTGPLVVVQGRSLSIGDTLAKAMRLRGYDVAVEWITNDSGAQLVVLARSLYARYRQIFDPTFPFPDDGYPGDYLIALAEAIHARDGESWIAAPEADWTTEFAAFGRDALVAEQRRTVARFGVHYDRWQSERELHENGAVGAGIARLTELGFTYEQDGAIFFRATAFGDDKDRVLQRGDGRPTYLAPDVAYHYQKLGRADRVIDILGPDHHGYIGRLKSLAAALGYEGKLEVLIAQQVTLMRGGEQVSMSKRSGKIVTLDDILDEVGIDATRFFFNQLSPESPLAFDLQLALEKSNDNPVYYVQYGHARVASILRKAGADDVAAARSDPSLALLVHPAELALARRLYDFPRVVTGVVDNLAPHRLARYARDVAADFHQFYTECKILTEDVATRRARLALALAAKSILARTLSLLGVSAPDTL